MLCACFMVSCAERELIREQSLESFAASDWLNPPELILDDGVGPPRLERIRRTWWRAVARAACSPARFVLLVEDDIIVNRWLHHNLGSWPPLIAARRWFYGSLYKPHLPTSELNLAQRYATVPAAYAWGAQAIVATPATLEYLLEQWGQEQGNPDEQMPRIAVRKSPIYYHVPSLVEHRKVSTTWGGFRHRSLDFAGEWRA